MTNLQNWFQAEILVVNKIDEDYRITGKNANWKADGGIFTGLDSNSVLSYGGSILSQLRSSLSKNYSVSVKDFGAQIVVDISYTNVRTCRTASMTFLVILASKEGEGIVKSSNIRWRSIGNPNQAVTYILSRKEEIRSKTESTN